MRIGILTVSDRASRGEYEDRGGPACEDWLRRVITTGIEVRRQIVADGAESVSAALRAMADDWGAGLVLVTGGTGPAPRDRTPEGVAAVADFDLPGFGEAMRAANLKVVPTAILSRQGAAVRGQTLIITLPGSPNAIGTSLDAVFAAVPYCLELIGAGRIDTQPLLIRAHRPKGA
jgi:molybdopterin adenylyltransferase